MRPLFTEGMGRKKQQGKSLWSDEGIKYYKHAERRWKELYKNESAMKDMYGGFERWLNKYGRNIIVAKNSIKSLHSVISMWVHEKTNKQLEHRLSENEGEHDSDNEEEDGYCSDKGTNRLSISWSKEERDRVDGVEEEVRDSNKRRRESNDESDESDNNTNNTKGRGSKKRHHKRQR